MCSLVDNMETLLNDSVVSLTSGSSVSEIQRCKFPFPVICSLVLLQMSTPHAVLHINGSHERIVQGQKSIDACRL